MRRAAAALPLLLLLGPARAALAVPAIRNPVEDYAGVLDEAQEERIAAVLRAVRADGGPQMAVLIVRTTDGRPIEDWSFEAASAWRGGDAERDDGVLLTLAVQDRRMRLELGEGLEPDLTDGRSRRILDAARDHFRANDYTGGILQIIADVVRHRGSDAPAADAPAADAPAADAPADDSSAAEAADGPPPLGKRGPWPYLITISLGLLAGALHPRRDQRRRWLAIAGIWCVAPAIVAAVFADGDDYAWVFATIWLTGAGIGCATAVTRRTRPPLGREATFAVAMTMFPTFLLMHDGALPVTEASDALSIAIFDAMGFGGVWFFAHVYQKPDVGPDGEPLPGGGDSGWGDWFGDGGDFGGGGASSDW